MLHPSRVKAASNRIALLVVRFSGQGANTPRRPVGLSETRLPEEKADHRLLQKGVFGNFIDVL